MRRFPWIALGLLSASVAALFITGYIAETHCAFGFGGFGCTQPFTGWGETLLGGILGFLALSAVLAVVLLWRLFLWWRNRSFTANVGSALTRGLNIMTDVTAVLSLDLSRYLGRWYEICRLPLKYEDETATDITATYSLNEDGSVRVDNRCFDEDGEPSQALGNAKPVDDAKSRLKVTFLPEFIRWIPFTSGDYWVLKIDPDYQVSLVGTPDRKNLWLLARNADLPDAIRDEYLAEARRQGFDLSALITPRHTGRKVTDTMIENS